jgi:glycosyltransferase involved in cell wall biosynthesis
VPTRGTRRVAETTIDGWTFIQVITDAEKWGARHADAVITLSAADKHWISAQSWLPRHQPCHTLPPAMRQDVAAIPPPTDVGEASPVLCTAKHPHESARVPANGRSALLTAQHLQILAEAPQHEEHRSAHAYINRQNCDDRQYLLCCVRLSPEKEPERFVELAAQLQARGALARLGVTPLLVGSSKTAYAEGLKHQFREQVPSGIVEERFLGPQDLAAVFARTALNVHPCRYDAFGMTIVEAASQGAPSIMQEVGSANMHAILSTDAPLACCPSICAATTTSMVHPEMTCLCLWRCVCQNYGPCMT